MLLIPDGYTEYETIGTVSMHFRPMLRPERLEVLRVADRYPSAGKKASIYSEAMAGHILAWSEPCPPGESTLLALRFRDPASWMLVLQAVLAVSREREQLEDAKRLHRTVLLQAFYPHLAGRDPAAICRYCRSHWFDPLSGETARIEGGKRPDEALPLCEMRVGACPLHHWSDPRGTSHRHRQAIEFDAECREAGQYPDDPIVKRNARIIGNAERKIAQRKLRIG